MKSAFKHAARSLALLGLVATMAGCVGLAPVNPPLAHADPEAGYRISQLLKRSPGPENSNEALVLLAFSGGGTRAASLSFGVLQELARTQVNVKGHTHRLLDEVDMVSGVSGGSFTALAYALHGDRLFSEYEERFLKRDVQGELLARAMKPANWGRLGSALYGRSELAADYYDEILFGGATYGDLAARRNAPLALVAGTELSSGARFEFSQDQFDFLCSDLSTVRLARAAATSSAVPVVLSPVTYRNYGGRCATPMPAWVKDVARADAPARPAGRALIRYREIEKLLDSAKRPYIHVVDGGVSDNLGLRGMIEAFQEIEASPAYQKQIGFAAVRHIVVIVVNSRSEPSNDWDRAPVFPGFLSQLLQSSSVPIDHFSSDSVELLKDLAQHWANRRQLDIAQRQLGGMSKAQAEAAVPAITFDAIDVSFDAIADPTERRYFMDLPTSFVLMPEQVDKLTALGGRLLRDSKGFQTLLRSIAQDQSQPQP